MCGRTTQTADDNIIRFMRFECQIKMQEYGHPHITVNMFCFSQQQWFPLIHDNIASMSGCWASQPPQSYIFVWLGKHKHFPNCKGFNNTQWNNWCPKEHLIVVSHPCLKYLMVRFLCHQWLSSFVPHGLPVNTVGVHCECRVPFSTLYVKRPNLKDLF